MDLEVWGWETQSEFGDWLVGRSPGKDLLGLRDVCWKIQWDLKGC